MLLRFSFPWLYVFIILHLYNFISLHVYIPTSVYLILNLPLFHSRKSASHSDSELPACGCVKRSRCLCSSISILLCLYMSTILYFYNFIFLHFYIFIFKDKGSDRLPFPETVAALSTFLASIHYVINMYRRAFDRKCNLIPFSENGFSIHTFWQPLIIVWRKLQRCLFQSLHDSCELLTKAACSRHADSRNEFRMSYKYFCNLRGEFNLME